MENWLYQVRVRLKKDLAEAIRFNKKNDVAETLLAIAKKHETSLVCTLDAFSGYVEEAENNETGNYPLYEWTKNTIENEEKAKKHSRAFSFYYKDDQIYSKKVAENLYDDLIELYKGGLIEELRLIDSNPKNNPQPPAR